MKLQQQFEQELDQSRQRRCGHGGRRSRAAATHLRHRRAQFARRVVQPVAARDGGARRGRRATDLERIGKSLADRLTYLMEPISPIEIDAPGVRRAAAQQPAAARRRRPQLLRADRPPRRRDRTRALPQGKRRRPPADRGHRHARSAAAAGGRFLRGAGVILSGTHYPTRAEAHANVRRKTESRYGVGPAGGQHVLRGRECGARDTAAAHEGVSTKLEVDYAIAGAMAMFLHGFRRFTEDVDVLVTREGLKKIHDSLEGRGYVKPFAASKNLRDAQTGVKIDFLISGQYPAKASRDRCRFQSPPKRRLKRMVSALCRCRASMELKFASGQAAHRLKDLGDVQQLIQHLKLPRELRG